MKNRIITICLFFSVFFALCPTSFATEFPAQESPPIGYSTPENNVNSTLSNRSTITVNVKVYQDKTYQTMYSGTSNMADTWVNVTPPFTNTWGLNLKHTIYNMNAGVSVTDTCPLAVDKYCTTSNCGSICKNDYITTSNHHKNLYAMYYQFYRSSWRGTSDILLGVTAIAPCKNVDGVHRANVVNGLSAVSGGCSVVVNKKTLGMKSNVRLLQHELSHAFGCYDQDGNTHVCSQNQNCINNGGFDNNYNYQLASIWCDNCKQDFDPRTYN